jgi:hypothetical protein
VHIDLPRFPALAKTRTDAERDAFVRVIAGSGYDPVGVAAVIEEESGWRPEIHGPKVFSEQPGYPVGLLQYAPSTARFLGTSTAELEGMSFLDQLAYIPAYYGKFGGPAAFREPGDYRIAGWGAHPTVVDSYVLAKSGSLAYKANAGLDWNRDGVITAADLRSRAASQIDRASANGFWSYDVEVGARPNVGSVAPLARSSLVGFEFWLGVGVLGVCAAVLAVTSKGVHRGRKYPR